VETGGRIGVVRAIKGYIDAIADILHDHMVRLLPSPLLELPLGVPFCLPKSEHRAGLGHELNMVLFQLGSLPVVDDTRYASIDFTNHCRRKGRRDEVGTGNRHGFHDDCCAVLFFRKQYPHCFIFHLCHAMLLI
jgi:hypothetical protein